MMEKKYRKDGIMLCSHQDENQGWDWWQVESNISAHQHTTFAPTHTPWGLY